MPSGLGQIFGKIMGPLQTAIGIGAAPFTGGATLPLALSGASQMMGPGGLLGSSAAPSVPSIKAPALTAAPMGPPAAPDIPTPAGGGLSLAVPGAGASPNAGAGSAAGGDIANLIAQALGTGGGGSPFAAFGG